jgi:hypothetical protein
MVIVASDHLPDLPPPNFNAGANVYTFVHALNRIQKIWNLSSEPSKVGNLTDFLHVVASRSVIVDNPNSGPSLILRSMLEDSLN